MVEDDVMLVASGNLITDDDGFGVDSDPDTEDLDVVSIKEKTAGSFENDGSVNGLYGTLTWVEETGAYEYTLNDSHPDVIALDDGETLTDTFTYTLSEIGRAHVSTQVTE